MEISIASFCLELCNN